MTFVDMQVKWSMTSTDRLGPEILTVLEIKGQVLRRVRLHVKFPGWLLNLNALLTKKLPKFLWWWRKCVFSFGIIAENFEVFENDIFDCKVLWVVGKFEWNSVGFFVFSAVSRSISWARCFPVVTAKSG